jgi:hypothetical protein
MKPIDYVLFFPGTLFCVASVIGWFIGLRDAGTVAMLGMACYAVACFAKWMIG